MRSVSHRAARPVQRSGADGSRDERGVRDRDDLIGSRRIAMKLTHLSIENFRCFGKAEFDLTQPGGEAPLDVALIVGGNGSGKSAVLQAIAGYFTELVPLYGGAGLGLSDIREGTDTAQIDLRWRDVDEVARPYGGPAGIFEHSANAFGLGRVPPGVHLSYSGTGMYMARRWAEHVAASTRDATGLLALYDVYRLLPPTTVTGPDVGAVIEHRCRDALAPSTRREGAAPYRHAQLKQWIVNMDYWRLKARVDRGLDSPMWETLHDALNTIFAPYAFAGVDDRFNVRFKTPTGTVPIEALSDGFRSVFVIVSDLLLRLSLAAPRPEEVLSQEAVCLIDEIDAHLHPRWQERVVPSLRAMFPRVQFIATTHSPIVVSTVSPCEVFRLEDEASP